MTFEEAYKYFKRRLSLGQCGKATTQRYAFEEAMEALEKQIPKKCRHNLPDLGHKYKHCPFCGQRLDRSDEE